jgi:hypothetical protein
LDSALQRIAGCVSDKDEAVWHKEETVRPKYEALHGLREKERELREKEGATEAATRDRGAAICARDAAVRERDATIRARDQAFGERDELMRIAQTKDAEIERLRKLAYGREVFDVDEGVSEVFEGRDEERAAKRVRLEQVKCSASVVQCLNMFPLSSHYISTSLRRKSQLVRVG